MTTYSQIATQLDKAFHARARSILGHHKYMSLVPKAKAAFEKGMQDTNINKRENTARRLSNLVYTKAISEVHNVK